MDIGLVTLPTDTSARFDELAVAAEERGFTHLYAGGDHTHIPASRTTPFPGGGDLPLAAPREPVRHLLEATGLIDVFSVYPSVEEAAETTRQAQAWSPAAPPLHAAPVTRSGRQRRRTGHLAEFCLNLATGSI